MYAILQGLYGACDIALIRVMAVLVTQSGTSTTLLNF